MGIKDFDYSKLKGRIREVCGTYSVFAEKLGCSLNTLSSKLNNKTSLRKAILLRAPAS